MKLLKIMGILIILLGILTGIYFVTKEEKKEGNEEFNCQAWTEENNPTDKKYFEFDEKNGAILGAIVSEEQFLLERDNITDLVIPCEIDGVEVLKIGFDAFGYDDNEEKETPTITSVVFPQTIEYIGFNAFANNKITSVDLGAVSEIGTEAFYNNELSAVAIPKETTIIGSNAFSGNKFLSNSNTNFITSSDLENSNVWILEYIGESDVVNIPNVYGVAGSVFYEKELTEVNFNEGIEIIGYRSFANNYLVELELPESIKIIDENAFSDNLLEKINIPSKLTHLKSQVFSYNNLTSIEIPDNITNIEMFAFSDNLLTEVTIPSSVTEIGTFAFSYNYLTNIVIPSSVERMGMYAFYENDFEFDENGYILSEDIEGSSVWVLDYDGRDDVIEIPSSATKIASAVFTFYGLKEVKLHNDITYIGEYAFSRNDLTNVELPANLTTIDVNAFGNNLLTSVSIPASVEYIGYTAFDSNDISEIILNGRSEEDILNFDTNWNLTKLDDDTEERYNVIYNP